MYTEGAMFVGVVEYLQRHITRKSEHNIQKYFQELIILSTLILPPDIGAVFFITASVHHFHHFYTVESMLCPQRIVNKYTDRYIII